MNIQLRRPTIGLYQAVRNPVYAFLANKSLVDEVVNFLPRDQSSLQSTLRSFALTGRFTNSIGESYLYRDLSGLRYGRLVGALRAICLRSRRGVYVRILACPTEGLIPDRVSPEFFKVLGDALCLMPALDGLSLPWPKHNAQDLHMSSHQWPFLLRVLKVNGMDLFDMEFRGWLEKQTRLQQLTIERYAMRKPSSTLAPPSTSFKNLTVLVARDSEIVRDILDLQAVVHLHLLGVNTTSFGGEIRSFQSVKSLRLDLCTSITDANDDQLSADRQAIEILRYFGDKCRQVVQIRVGSLQASPWAVCTDLFQSYTFTDMAPLPRDSTSMLER